jgi:hypothetical protein
VVAAGEKPTILLRFGHDAERGMKLNPSMWGEAVASAHLSHAMQLLNKKILKVGYCASVMRTGALVFLLRMCSENMIGLDQRRHVDQS